MNLSNKDLDKVFKKEVVDNWEHLDHDFKVKYATYASKSKHGGSVGPKIKMEMLRVLGITDYWLTKEEQKELLKVNSKK